MVVELPGVDPDSIEVARRRALAADRGRSRAAAASTGQVYQQMEIEYGRFERVLELTEDVDVEQASASYDRGLLTVTFPIAQRPARLSRVEISIRRS